VHVLVFINYKFGIAANVSLVALTYITDRILVSPKFVIFLVNKTNRCTEIQFYWYYNSTCFGQHFCPSSGVLSRTSALVHFYAVLMTVCYKE